MVAREREEKEVLFVMVLAVGVARRGAGGAGGGGFFLDVRSGVSWIFFILVRPTLWVGWESLRWGVFWR